MGGNHIKALVGPIPQERFMEMFRDPALELRTIRFLSNWVPGMKLIWLVTCT